MTERVFVLQSGDRIWSPNSKDDLCRAVHDLIAQVERLWTQLDDANIPRANTDTPESVVDLCWWDVPADEPDGVA